MSRTSATYAAAGSKGNSSALITLANLFYLNQNMYFSFQNFLQNSVYQATNLKCNE